MSRDNEKFGDLEESRAGRRKPRGSALDVSPSDGDIVINLRLQFDRTAIDAI